MTQDKKFKWTAIFLIKAADNIPQLSQMLTQLTKVEKDGEIAVVLCINIKAGIAPEVLSVPVVLGPGDAPIRRTGWTTLFYNLERNAEGGCAFRLLREKPDFRMDIREHIAAFFSDVVLSSFAAERYMLFTWDHGQPFGMFPVRKDESPVTENKIHPAAFHFRLKEQLDREALKPGTVSRMARALENELPILTVTELKQGIELAFNGQKIDVVVMANCFLQFFDTGFELSSCVDYLVAFETQMFFRDAFDYKRILETIGNDPQLTPENLAKSIVCTYSIDRNKENIPSKNSVALFANDLSWYPVMAKLIDELATTLIAEMPRYHNTIRAAIDKCAYISPDMAVFCLIDFRNFIRCLNNEAPSLFRSAPYALFEKVLDKLVVAAYIGNDFIGRKNSRLVSPSCFSVYLPRDSGDYTTFFVDNFMKETSLSPTEFVRRFKWESFINSYVLQ